MKTTTTITLYTATLNELDNYINTSDPIQLGTVFNMLVVAILNSDLMNELINLSNKKGKKHVIRN